MPKIYSYEFKKAVVNFYNSDMWSPDNAVHIFNSSLSSIYNWISLNKFNLLTVNSNVRTSYDTQLNDEVQKYIVKYVIKKVSFTRKNLKRCVKRIFNVSISKSSIYRILKKHNITNKKIYNKIVPKQKNTKKQVKQLITNIEKIGADNITSIDESSFDTQMIPTNGWSKKGTKIVKPIFPIRKRVTLTLAVSNKKVIGSNIINGSSNASNFKKFLKEDVLPLIKNNTILMDNVKFHHNKDVQKCIIDSGNKYIYNVSYNPNTNPVENCFYISKNHVNKKEPRNEIELTNAIINSLKLLTPQKLSNMFKNSFDHKQINNSVPINNT